MITEAQSVNAFTGTAPDKLERVPMKTLGQDEFLQLLVTQMRNDIIGTKIATNLEMRPYVGTAWVMAVRTFRLKNLTVNAAPIGIGVEVAADIRLRYIWALQANTGVIAVGATKGGQTADDTKYSEH